MDDDRHGIHFPGSLQERERPIERDPVANKESLRIRARVNKSSQLYLEHKPLIEPVNM